MTNVINGTNIGETIDGTSGSDQINGLGGDDIINPGSGNDTIDGGDGINSVNFTGPRSNYNIFFNADDNLVVQDNVGSDGTNILVNVINLFFSDGGFSRLLEGQDGVGTNGFNDFLQNTDVEDFINGRGDFDPSVNGRQSFDQVDYRNAVSAINANFSDAAVTVNGITIDANSVQDGSGNVDTVLNVETIFGSAFNDILIGSSDINQSFELFRPGEGDDFIDGGSGFNRVRYNDNGSTGNGVIVNLSDATQLGVVSGTARDEFLDTDTLVNINSVQGSNFADSLFGGDGNEQFRAQAGNDLINGGGGSDEADYAFTFGGSSFGAIVDLAAGTARDTFGDTDTLISIENVRGSNFDDQLRGDSQNNQFRVSVGGNDLFDGRGGFDTIRFDYENLGGGGLVLNGGINANLVTNTIIGADGASHSVFNIENVEGSNFNDTIIGDSLANRLEGRGGNDILTGGAGADAFVFENTTSISAGAAGFDPTDFGNDTITDFNAAEDTIEFNSVAAASLLVNQSGSNVVVTIAGQPQNSVTIQNSTVAIVEAALAATNGAIATSGNDVLNGTGGNDTISGLEGNDTIDGSDGFDIAGFSGPRSNFSISFDANNNVVVQDNVGSEGIDTLANIEGLSFDDSFVNLLLGQDGSDQFGFTDFFVNSNSEDIINGFGDFDSLVNGRNAFDQVDYRNAQSAINANFSDAAVTVNGITIDANSVQDGSGNVDTVLNVEVIFGSAFNDILIGGNPNNDLFELFRPGEGDDFIDGGSGFNRVRYNDNGFTGNGIIVNLSDTTQLGVASGTVRDEFLDTDTLVNINSIQASNFADSLFGGDGNEQFRAQAGNDTIDGGGGIDEVDYDFTFGGSSFGAIVDLAAGTATDTFGNTDTLISIENVRGSNFSDQLRGDSQNNQFRASTGGNDLFDGRGGIDTIRFDYESIPGGGLVINTGINANLVTNTIIGGDGASHSVFNIENVDGSNFNDTIVGDGLANRIEGRGGNDTLTGGAGADTFVFEDTSSLNAENLGFDPTDFGNDTITDFNAAEDTIEFNSVAAASLLVNQSGSNVVVTIAGQPQNSVTIQNSTVAIVEAALGLSGPAQPSAGNDVLDGTTGNDTIDGLAGNDTINGLAGDDTLIGGLGADVLNGGEGSDTASFENSSALAIVDLFGGPNFGVEATGDTFVSIENVTGSAFGDIIQGNQEANVINGLGGADNLTAFGGADTVNGGDGADFIQGVSGNNTINGDGGADTIFGGVDADTINGGTEGDTLFGADGNDTINGDAGNDGINAGAGNDTVDGGAGSDVIFGDAGIDMISGGDDGDTIFGGADADTLNGNDGDDALVGEGGGDFILGGDGLDFLSGGAGVDILNGDAGSDLISGGDDGDILNGGADNDVLFGDAGADTLNGGAGVDVLFGDDNALSAVGAGGDVLNGGDDGDLLFGGSGVDTLNGDAGDDVIFGGADADFIRGGSGTDFLLGDAGADTFIFEVGQDFDGVLDFEDGIDTLDLTAFGFADEAAALAAAVDDSAGVFFNFGDGDSATIFGVTEADLMGDILV